MYIMCKFDRRVVTLRLTDLFIYLPLFNWIHNAKQNHQSDLNP